MKEYQVSGELMKGFVGTITYETTLPKQVRELEIQVSFQKREMEKVTEADIKSCKAAWMETMETEPDDRTIDDLIRKQKTEINVTVFHNDAYLGCAHRDEKNKVIFLSPHYASPGFVCGKMEGGTLRVVLHVYQILNDHTPYTVKVIGKETEE